MSMIAVKCPQCGADIQLDDSREFGFCNYCGTKVMQDKVVVEHRGSVKIDETEELKNLLVLARRAKDENNTENAKNYYQQILIKNPSNWEASFYSVYYQTASCKIGEINIHAERLKNCEKSVLSLINDQIEEQAEKEAAVNEIANRLLLIAPVLYQSYYDFYKQATQTTSVLANTSLMQKYEPQYIATSITVISILFEFSDHLKALFGNEKFGDLHAACLKKGIELQKMLIKTSVLMNKELKETLQMEIELREEALRDYDESYSSASTDYKKKGCYVATAVYGSYDCPEVWTLRRFRDNSLALTWYGRLFITLYYAISPTIVKWFGQTKWFNKMWKGKLDRMVKKLQSEGYADTPYQDKNWK